MFGIHSFKKGFGFRSRAPYGTSFPLNPHTGDFFYRTDLKRAYTFIGVGEPLTTSGWLCFNTAGSTVLGSYVAMSSNTIYLAATDGFVSGAVQLDNANKVYLYSDSNPSPSTVIAVDSGFYVTASLVSIQGFVRKGDYWKVTPAFSGSGYFLWWIPLGA